MARGKPQLNLAAPPEIVAEFDRLAGAIGIGGKQRWMLSTAAILMLLERSEAEVNEYVQDVAAADVRPGGVQELIDSAKKQQAGRRSKGTGTKRRGTSGGGGKSRKSGGGK